MKKIGKVLVVDDNAGIRSALKILLPMRFEAVEILPSPTQLISTVNSFQPDVILLDMNFNTDINTGNEGLFWLSELRNNNPNQKVVLFTAYADISLAVEGMKRGAIRLHREAVGEREIARHAGKGGDGEPEGQSAVK